MKGVPYSDNNDSKILSGLWSGLFDVVSQGCASKFAELAFEVGNDRVESKFSICDEKYKINIYVYLALHCFQS